MSNMADQRWNIFVGAAVGILCSFSGWLALEIIELKRQVVRLESQQIGNKEDIDTLVEALVMPRFESKPESK